jgi:hypothetical protein
MLKGIMRHPAGLMKRALGVRFQAVAPREEHAPAPRPDYWLSRYSKPGFSLLVPAPPAPGASHVGLVHRLHPERALIAAQDGKASTYLHPVSPAPEG